MKRAIVIGAGVAGASAAFRLKQAGVSVHLLERDDRVGGRTRSERVDGFIIDVGAGLLPGTYQAVYDLMADSGLRDVLEPMLSPTAVVRDGRLHYLEIARIARSIVATRLLGPRSKLELAKVALQLFRMRNVLDFEDLAPAARFDTQSLAQYGAQSLSAELYEYFLNPTQKIMYTVSGADASIVDFFWCMKNLLSPTAFCIRGGMDRIVDQVARQLEVSVNCEATGVVETADQVEVTWRSRDSGEVRDRVDFCVIATPAREVPRIYGGLSAPAREYLGKLRYSVLTNLHLRLTRRLDERAVLIMIPDATDVDLCGILIDHNKGSDRAPSGKGAVSAYFADRWGQTAYGWSDAEIFAKGIAKVERVIPGIKDLVEGYIVQRWDYAATASYPGYYRALAPFMKEIDTQGRVQLAGDYFSMASVNTAATSGAIAARRLIRRYL